MRIHGRIWIGNTASLMIDSGSSRYWTIFTSSSIGRLSRPKSEDILTEIQTGTDNTGTSIQSSKNIFFTLLDLYTVPGLKIERLAE